MGCNAWCFAVVLTCECCNHNLSIDKNADPTQMCQSPVDKLAQSKQLRSITGAELLVLFDEWLEELDAEVIDCGKRHPGVTAKVLARELGLSHRGARFLVSKLKREGKL